MMYLKPHINIAFAYFLLAALLGVVLRSFHSVEIPLKYKYIVHAHSHIALLGWVYVALTTLLYKLFVQNEITDKKYRLIFWFTQFTLVGMLLTFPFTGYALFSIVFSTLFLFASDWFFFFFIRHTKCELKNTNVYKCVKTALWYMVFSSIGPWALGAIMSTLGHESVWYRLSIYFYLHFQYNGWMILALIGLFLFFFEQHGLILSPKTFKRFFGSINTGILLTFFLSTLWTEPPFVINIFGGLGAISQLVALLLLLRFVLHAEPDLKTIFSSFQIRVVRAVAALLTIKMLLQLLTVLPYFERLTSIYLDFIVGYLHLTFLGVITLGLFFFLDIMKLKKIPKKAYYLYVFSFVITEMLIFYKGFASWKGGTLFTGYFDFLTLGSFLIPLSIATILFADLRLFKK